MNDRSEIFVTRNLPLYFFKNSELKTIALGNVSDDLIQKLQKILPRLEVAQRDASCGLYLSDRYKSKTVTRAEIIKILSKMAPQGILFVVSHRDWGVKSLVRDLSEFAGNENVEILERGMAGYRLLSVKYNFVLPKAPSLENKVTFEIKALWGEKKEMEMYTSQSLFSALKLDDGTRLLLENIDFRRFANMLEIGTGWGAIGVTAAILIPAFQATLTEVDNTAIKITKKNLNKYHLKSRVQVISARKKLVKDSFDLLVSYPPFHLSNVELEKILTDYLPALKPNAVVYFGTDQTYQKKFTRLLTKVFGKVEIHRESGKYRILKATYSPHSS